jgi:trehalose 6-phosphate phosphatase
VRALNPNGDLSRFFDRVGRAEQRALLLDYDGTLAPFRVERDQAVPYPGVREILEVILDAANTRAVIISGRGVRELIPLLELKSMPEIWGSHGRERLLPDGTYHLDEISEQASHALLQADDWTRQIGRRDNWERKPASLAFHWRGLEAEEVSILGPEVLANWEPLALESGLEIHEFDGGLELRVPGPDKGSAVRTILSEMDPESVAAFLGDDRTDEDAFQAIKGRGLGVLVRGELRPTEADLWLVPPKELLEFLGKWARIPTSD